MDINVTFIIFGSLAIGWFLYLTGFTDLAGIVIGINIGASSVALIVLMKKVD